MSCKCCAEENIDFKKEQYMNGELSKEDYLSFLKAKLIELIVSLDFERGSVDKLDEIRKDVFEIYFLIGSVILDMDLKLYEAMSFAVSWD